MRRRHLLRSAFAALPAALISSRMSRAYTSAPSSTPEPQDSITGTASPANPTPEFYVLRRYLLRNGPQTQLTEAYFTKALIPALHRLGLGPIGAFRLEIGPETPSFYLLLPGRSVELLVTAPQQIAQDEQFLSAAEPFWAAPATAPAFARVESSLLRAFSGWPRMIPVPGGPNSKRIFQLRTYESPSDRDHIRKIEMFEHGEFDIFRNAGFHQVFYGSNLIGQRLPSLTYMLSAPDQAALDASWQKFRNDPAWHKLSTDPRYSYEEIVSNITNLILSPLACSEI